MNNLPIAPREFETHASGLHDAPLNRSQFIIVAILLIILVIDGMDVGILSVAAPKIIAEWRATKSAFSFALSAAPAGMALGSIVGGWLGDRFGRKSVVLASTFLFGATTMLSAAATDVTVLALLRLVCGIGFGAASPSAIALAAEWVSPMRKNRIGSVMSVGAPLGVMLASWIGLALLAVMGWRGTFVAFGLLALVFALVTWFAVPESPGFLRARGKDAKAQAFEYRVFGRAGAPVFEAATPSQTATRGFLRYPGFGRFNFGIWIAFLSSAYVTYAMASWLPVILQGLGFAFADAVRGLFFMTFMALIGTASAGSLTARLGSRALGLAIAAAALLFIGIFVGVALRMVPHGALLINLLCGGIGLTQGLIAGVLYGLISASYPLEIRSTGIGIGLMLGKVGGVLAVLIGGRLLDSGAFPEALTIGTFGVAVLVLGGSIALIDRHVLPQSRRSIAA